MTIPKSLRYGIKTLLFLLGVVFIIFNYDFFIPEYIPAPDERLLSTQCDPNNGRQVRVFTLDDGTVDPGILVGVRVGCGNRITDPEIIIFACSADTVHDDDVKVNWTNANTLTIAYKKNHMIDVKKDTVTFADPTLNFVAVYKEME